MAQQWKVGTVATTVAQGPKHMVVTYHRTQVVQFNDQEIILNSGGWRTSTTKTRMNQTSHQFDLGFNVYQNKGDWFVSYKGTAVPFEDGMVITR